MNHIAPTPTFYRGYILLRVGDMVEIRVGSEKIDEVQNMGLARAVVNEWHEAR